MSAPLVPAEGHRKVRFLRLADVAEKGINRRLSALTVICAVCSTGHSEFKDEAARAALSAGVCFGSELMTCEI